MIYERKGRTALRSCFATSSLIWILGPKRYLTDWTQLSNVAVFVEEGNMIFAFWESFQVLSSKVLRNYGTSEVKA